MSRTPKTASASPLPDSEKISEPKSVPPVQVANGSDAVGVENGDLVELQVWSIPPVNHTLLICHFPDADGTNPMALVNVQVRDNALFLKKMRLRARKVADKRFVFEGPCPRWRGKW